MSGDVQPRKRKDKKRKKDELGVEEPRGTAADLGEGDVFMHSQHDHGTGGHWCAKIIFFSLLAVLIALIGLIILENRGLSELEANSVETRYSGVLEGWLEDAPDDDHHDEHTLELKHHDEDDDHDDVDDHDVGVGHGLEDEHDDDDEHGDEPEDDDEIDDEDENDDDEDENDDEEHSNEDDDEELEQDVEPAEDEDEDERPRNSKYYDDDDEDEFGNDDEQHGDDDDNEDEQEDEGNDNDNVEQDEDETLMNKFDDFDQDVDDDDEGQSVEKYDGGNDDNGEENDEASDDEDEEEHEDGEEDTEIEVEKIEKEASENEEPISLELPVLPEDDDDDKEPVTDEDKKEDEEEDDETAEDDDDDDEDFSDGQLPLLVEHYTAPSGQPFQEVEEAVSSEKPPDTLEEEEEYEKQQEELRREQEQASHMWLKLVVGGALLLATHAVMRRATGPRDTPESEEHEAREETPIIDRRMTLISEESTESVTSKKSQERSKPVEEVPKKESEEEEDQEVEEVEVEEIQKEEKELYSDEEEAEDDEDVVEVKKAIPKQTAPVVMKPAPVAMKPAHVAMKPAPVAMKPAPVAMKPAPVVMKPAPEPAPEEKDEDIPDDVEIIDEEQLEEELEEEDDDEEEISDVDDAELLTRLEAKYGRLPEPERPGQRHKDGGNSLEDEWPGEPSDPYWRRELDAIERELRQGEGEAVWAAVAERAVAPQLRDSARARYLAAAALDRAAETLRDNHLLSRAIAAYIHLLKMNEGLSDKKLLEVTDRTLDRIQFRGNYLNAEPVYRLLIRRFPDYPTYRNNLTISFLMANRADLAEEVLKETLARWPNNRVALAHYAFVLKTHHNRLEEAVKAFQKALEGDKGPACEPRFYYHLGDALLQLNRYPEAHEIHKRGAKLGHFLSPAQRSLYNVPRLKSQPWWNVEQTPYSNLARALEKSWRDILKEGEEAQAMYEMEREGLKERGEWSQLDLFARGREVPDRCKRAPVTCSIVRSEPAAVGCRRGQVKFSAMEPGTHVRPHVGPTNCRLRMHLALSNTKDTYIRVDQETRQWQEGKVLMFDDSFEHEVWHNGTGKRLVIIVDVWHPDLTPTERRTLSAI